MSKKIIFDHNGKHYTLEYNRDSVRWMEYNGFKIGEESVSFMDTQNAVFRGAFKMHHEDVFLNDAEIDEMWAHVKKKNELLSVLSGMALQVFLDLMDEPEDGNEGNIEWSEVG